MPNRLAQSEAGHTEALRQIAAMAHELLHASRDRRPHELNTLGDILTDILVELGGVEVE
jgi:hypothetical protein